MIRIMAKCINQFTSSDSYYEKQAQFGSKQELQSSANKKSDKFLGEESISGFIFSNSLVSL